MFCKCYTSFAQLRPALLIIWDVCRSQIFGNDQQANDIQFAGKAVHKSVMVLTKEDKKTAGGFRTSIQTSVSSKISLEKKVLSSEAIWCCTAGKPHASPSFTSSVWLISLYWFLSAIRVSFISLSLFGGRSGCIVSRLNVPLLSGVQTDSDIHSWYSYSRSLVISA